MEKTLLMEKRERELGESIESVIGRMVEQGSSYEQIARYLDVSYWTLQNWMARLGVKVERRVTFAGVAK